jgi:hypothetical protein
METKHVRILRYDIKGGYRIIEELWWYCPEVKPARMISAYTDNGDYIGNPEDAKFLCKRMRLTNLQKVDPSHCVVSIGFSEKEQKWYGWSHRAIYGFGIGSIVQKGDCAYTPKTPLELYEDMTAITTSEDGFEYQCCKPEDVEMTETGIKIRQEMSKSIFDNNGMCTHYEPSPDEFYEIECGRGEWTATTLEEAKLMAIDFNRGVS